MDRAALFTAWLGTAGLLAGSLIVPEQSLFFYTILIPLLAILAVLNETGFHKGSWAAWIAFWAAVFCAGILGSRLGAARGGRLVLPLLAQGCAVAFAENETRRLRKQSSHLGERIAEIRERLKQKLNENAYYRARIEQIKSQVRHRQQLSAYAREMGNLLEPEMIKRALLEAVQRLYPEEEVRLKTSLFGGDPLDAWCAEKRAALLVKDLAADSRFPQGAAPAVRKGSCMIAPITVERGLAGLLRVESAQAHRLTEPDLQQLEIYTDLAILALENAQLFAKVNAMATRDGLTGLATHRIFQEKLVEELLRAARYRTSLSLLILDIDHFKRINDGHGHRAGDAVLQELARLLQQGARPVDFAARYGGEEFCLILPEFSPEAGARRAEDLRSVIERLSVPFGGEPLRFTVSMGCASFPEDAQTSSQLIRKADERLYRAKSSGRNRVVFHD